MLFRKEWPFPKEFHRISNHQWKIVHCHDSRRIDQKSTRWRRLRWYGSNGHPAFSCKILSPSHWIWAGGSRKLLGGILINSLEAWPMKSRWVSEGVRDGIHHITSIFTLYHIYIYIHCIYIYISYTSYGNSAPIRLTGIHQPILKHVCTCIEALKPWIYGWWHCFTNIKSSQFKEYPIITYIQIHMKISSNHHKSSPMILKIGSQISNRYPTDIQQISNHRWIEDDYHSLCDIARCGKELWGLEPMVLVEGPRVTPGRCHGSKNQWEIDGKNHGKILKSMETWKKNDIQSEKPCEIHWKRPKGGFNDAIFEWCFLVGNRRPGWDAAMVHMLKFMFHDPSIRCMACLSAELRLEQSFPQARLWVFRTAHLLLLVRLAVEPSCSDRFSKRQEMWNLPKVVRSWLVLEDTGVSFKLCVENSNPNIPSHKGIQIPLWRTELKSWTSPHHVTCWRRYFTALIPKDLSLFHSQWNWRLERFWQIKHLPKLIARTQI